MTSINTRTPPLPIRSFNQQSNSTVLPAKPKAKTIVYNQMLEPRPDTPRFHRDSPNLSGPFNRNQLLQQNLTGNLSKQINNHTGRNMNGENINKSNINGKRPATTEVIDLTNTTGGITPPSSVPPTKKSKTGIINQNNNNNKSATRVDAKGKAKHDKAIAESVAWRQKYKKAFPSFVFYFDALDHATEVSLVKAVERLGATVDNFFSKQVTHVVTSRTVPPVLSVNKENFNSPSVPHVQSRGKPALPDFLQSAAGPSRTKKSTGRSPANYADPSLKLRQPYDQAGDRNPFIVDSNDILSKAAEFGLKIWRLDKAQLVISRINAHSPTKHDNQRNLSLPSLLRDEQVYGTRERDPFVPRPDTHYFAAQSCYVLVEDSTGEHRPIVTKEYERPRKREDPSWPVLWGGVESRTAFYHYEGPPVVYEAKRSFTSLFEPPKIQEGESQSQQLLKNKPINFSTAAPGNLRRSLSMSQIQKNSKNPSLPFVPEGGVNLNDKYIAASGNSQIITSNVASGTSNQSGAVRGINHDRATMCNRRLAALKRLSVPMGGGGGGAPGKLKRSASLDAGLNAKAPPARDEPKKPGYCENCRIKYEDFKMHVVSRKHVKFARTASNWTELDALLERIDRPYLLPPSSDYSSPVEEEADSGFFGSDNEFIEEECPVDGEETGESNEGVIMMI